ncbi:MAG: preprotein translocase subunit SecA [Helicobacteraceae bacterium]
MLKMIARVVGTKNDRMLKKYKKRVERINALADKYKALSDEDLRQSFLELGARAQSPQDLDKILEDSFAITREASTRVLGMRHFDVQLIGGMVLNDGMIAEMKTGEGKTLVATLAVCLNALLKKGVHVVTVNDYLAKRDGSEMGRLYNFLGLSVGIITGDLVGEEIRKKQYEADITYGTNNEFGFDYLRDNMKYNSDDIMQKFHHFAIVDEVDSILIDEARTPLIISGPTNAKMQSYGRANSVAAALVKDKHFSVDEKNRVILLNDDGIEKAEELFGVQNMYDMQNAALSHYLDQALKAHYLFEKDVDYVVRDDEIVIVDEFTGRLSEGRRFSEGLHQALEAKEGVLIKEESQTLADITFQNYFRLYDKLSGMTGTAQTEAAEFSQIYGLDVVSIPTNLPVVRQDKNDLIYKSQREKFDAVIKRIVDLHKSGQPILVGTISIEQSEHLSKLLQQHKIPHNVLNAKQHEKEAQIIQDAGNKGSVTIATNMAGRGVDIKISDEVKKLGGLYIIGTERHESRRIDNQLRGRAGRQGDPGASQFYLSLEDNLLRIFGSDKIKTMMEKLGIEEGEYIESRWVTRAVENAQKKVESMHFESRKHLLEYDDVANAQRKVIYSFRRELLQPQYNIDEKIKEMRQNYLNLAVKECGISPLAAKEDYDTSRLVTQIKEDTKTDLNVQDFAGLQYDELLAKLYADLSAQYDAKFGKIPREQAHEIQRVIFLQILDEIWREHLYQMDILKTGIGLRSYNQKDPLVEYKKESFLMFSDLVERVKNSVIKTLHTIEFAYQDEQEQIEQMKTARANEDLAMQRSIDVPKQAPKIPRNAPCPCGSGKKYKACCGKSGPKKGILAK